MVNYFFKSAFQVCLASHLSPCLLNLIFLRLPLVAQLFSNSTINLP